MIYNNFLSLVILFLFQNSIALASSPDTLKCPINYGVLLGQNKKNTYSAENSYGIFIKPTTSLSVKSCSKGKITHIGRLPDSSYFVVIDINKGIQCRYMYMNKVIVKNKDLINEGDIIGYLNNNSNLFFIVSRGLTFLDPKPYLVFL